MGLFIECKMLIIIGITTHDNDKLASKFLFSFLLLL